MDNAIGKIKSFNDLLIKANTIIEGLKEVGTDVDKIISLANSNGYDFSVEDLEELKNEFCDSQEQDTVNGVVAAATVVVVVGVVVVV